MNSTAVKRTSVKGLLCLIESMIDELEVIEAMIEGRGHDYDVVTLHAAYSELTLAASQIEGVSIACDNEESGILAATADAMQPEDGQRDTQ